MKKTVILKSVFNVMFNFRYDIDRFIGDPDVSGVHNGPVSVEQGGPYRHEPCGGVFAGRRALRPAPPRARPRARRHSALTPHHTRVTLLNLGLTTALLHAQQLLSRRARTDLRRVDECTQDS